MTDFTKSTENFKSELVKDSERKIETSRQNINKIEKAHQLTMKKSK